MAIKINSLVNTPNGRGVVLKEEVFRGCERWGVALEIYPFSFPIAYYFKNEVTAIDECECVFEYNDDHHGTHVYQCPKCGKAEKELCDGCNMPFDDCCCSDLNQR